MVGNPLIADVTLQPGGIVVVTGKGYGATNFIAMDRAGEILVDRLIQVEGPADPIITVYRGVERESLSCMPICQPRVTLGDADSYFKPAIDQAGTLSGQANGSAAAPASRRTDGFTAGDAADDVASCGCSEPIWRAEGAPPNWLMRG